MILTGCLSPALKLGVDPVACKLKRHALYDIGSGSTKLTILETNSCKPAPQVLLKISEKVDYKDDLIKARNSEFTNTIQKMGFEALKKLKAQAVQLKAESHYGVATAAFREAKNSGALVQQIKLKLDILIEVISQEKEAQLAYRAVRLYYPEPGLLVWDVGGGSFQFTTYDLNNKEWNVFKGRIASVAIKDYVINKIKKNPNLTSPNPLTLDEIKSIRAYIRQELGADFKNSFLNKKAFRRVLGVEAVLNKSLKEYLSKSTFTISDIEQWILNNHNKNDKDFNDPYAATLVTNMILISEIMKMLDIHEIQTLDVSMVEGLVVDHQIDF